MISGPTGGRSDAMMTLMTTEQPETEWVVILGYENLPGCARPIDAVCV